MNARCTPTQKFAPRQHTTGVAPVLTPFYHARCGLWSRQIPAHHFIACSGEGMDFSVSCGISAGE
jgi:hypothetical protein